MAMQESISKLSNEELEALLNSESNEKYDEIVNQSDTVSTKYITTYQILYTHNRKFI